MNILFVDMPRTAGTSILSVIGRPEGVADSVHHVTCRDWVKALGHQRYAALTRFTVIRHPIDRFVSAYCYLKDQTPENPYWEDDRKERESLTSLNEVARWPPSALYRMEHFRPQMLHLIGESGTVEVEHMLRFERLGEAWAEFAREFGLPPKLPHLNSGNGADREGLSEASRAALHKTFAIDFQVLNYE